MNKPIIIIGMGELGELFAQGFLKLGFPVVPVLRSTPTASLAREIPEPELVLVAVGEDDLQSVLDRLPENWGKHLALLQNELMPRDWRRHGLPQPHVIVVWFDKKKGRPCVSVLPTLVAGPKAVLIVSALTRIDVPCRAIPETDVVFEMIRKNLYILTINIAGLRTGGTVSQLWEQHRSLAQAVASEILDIQEWLAGEALPRERLLKGMLQGFDGDPNHICTGRSAPVRLRRALRIAREAGIDTPTLDAIARDIEQTSSYAPR